MTPRMICDLGDHAEALPSPVATNHGVRVRLEVTVVRGANGAWGIAVGARAGVALPGVVGRVEQLRRDRGRP